VDGRCAVLGWLGEYWKLLIVLVDKYLVHHAEDVACFALSMSIREGGNKGRRLALWGRPVLTAGIIRNPSFVENG